jgi:hypothetical protein
MGLEGMQALSFRSRYGVLGWTLLLLLLLLLRSAGADAAGQGLAADAASAVGEGACGCLHIRTLPGSADALLGGTGEAAAVADEAKAG